MSLEDKIKMSNFKNEHQKALLNLYRTVYKMLYNEKQFLSSFDITSQQYNILKILKGQDRKPISIKEIRSRMLDNFSDTGRIVARLEKKQLVQKENSSIDKRAFNVIISKKGLNLIKKIDANSLKEWGTGIFKLTEDDASQLNEILDKID